MRRYSETINADIRRRIDTSDRQILGQISAEPSIVVVSLYNWKRALRLYGELVRASKKENAGWRVTA
jgi:transposase